MIDNFLFYAIISVSFHKHGKASAWPLFPLGPIMTGRPRDADNSGNLALSHKGGTFQPWELNFFYIYASVCTRRQMQMHTDLWICTPHTHLETPNEYVLCNVKDKAVKSIRSSPSKTLKMSWIEMSLLKKSLSFHALQCSYGLFFLWLAFPYSVFNLSIVHSICTCNGCKQLF